MCGARSLLAVTLTGQSNPPSRGTGHLEEGAVSSPESSGGSGELGRLLLLSLAQTRAQSWVLALQAADGRPRGWLRARTP